MPYIFADRLIEQLTELLTRQGVSLERARRVATLYAEASADGVYSHGVNFIPSLLKWLQEKLIADTESPPELISAFGSFARYDGKQGFGSLNAEFCIDRAMALADQFGVGAVGLRNTGHWGRPGNYGWRAAERGYLALCWTNTPPVLPPWEGTVNAIGNNPIVFAVPGENGKHLVLDMAMSQFSVGRLNTYRAENKVLPAVGGVDREGNPTTDPAAILEGGHAWPIGFWKGSGMAILLDAFASILADGLSTAELAHKPAGLGNCQIFIVFNPRALGGRESSKRTQEIVCHLAETNPASRFPGQAALDNRKRSLQEGIYVRDDIWAGLGLKS